MKLRPVLEAFGRSPAAADLANRLPARAEALRLGGLHGSSGFENAGTIHPVLPLEHAAPGSP